jgi:hypothetical protein
VRDLPTFESYTRRSGLVAALAVLGLGLLAPARPAALAAQEAAPPDSVVRPRLHFRVPLDTSLALRVPPALRPGGRLAPASPPDLVALQWAAETRALMEQRRRERFRQRLLAALALVEAPPDTAAPAIVIPRPEELIQAEPEQPDVPAALEALAGYADLGLDVNAHIETKLDRLRNARCTTLDLANPTSGCRGGFPTPSFDQQFRVRAGGIISERLNVNVDFDSEREFDANNNINVWYQGLEDEILRRVDVGTVSLRAPPSRFVTAAIPSNSFGVQAEAQLGPLDVRSIVAQQQGSALRTRTFTVGETTTQPVTFESRDLDFESGRFFFVVDPRGLPAYPRADMLTLVPDTLPAAFRLAQVRVYRLQAQTGRAEDNPNLGGINALAIRSDSPQRVGPLTWQLLVEGRDYYLDPSGVWFALVRRVSSDEFLAVSYITAAGDTVGTFPAVNTGTDTLELVFEPRRGPDVPTFFHELRNVYRVGGSDIDRSTIDVRIEVNGSERPLNGQGTYLQRLGLALSTDPSTVDAYNRVFPRERDPNQGEPIRDLFVVFPHLTPLADSTRLERQERNDSLYRTPTYLLSTEGPPPRFAMQFAYDATGAGDRSTLNLGALQVRDGSERLFAGDRQLVRGRDYEIDYELGQVRFLHPDSLFFGPTEVRAQFEENQLFDIAPKSILGLATTYHLGPDARIHGIAMFQRDRTAFLRPLLGFEPESHFIGGVSTDLLFRPDGLTRALDALPLIETTVPSRLEINGEIAVSKPNPNQAGVAFVEDFQGEAARPISLLEREFQLGSAPESGRGLSPAHLGAGGTFDPSDVAPLVWQNAIQMASGGVLEFGPQDIDSTIALTGQGFQIEPVLWMSLLPDTIGGAPQPGSGVVRWIVPHTPGPRWRSITQPLGGGSGVGVDLSRVEFLEFWVLEDADLTARQQNAVLVLDFGRVFEDAVAAAPERLSVSGSDTVFTGFRLVGEGRLDSEKDTLTNVFNAVVDDIGIHGDLADSIIDDATGELVSGVPLCDLRGIAGVPVFQRGDLVATCTRRNNRMDTEDLDGDNRLDRSVGVLGEDVFRYVFPVGDETHYVRDGVSLVGLDGESLTWRLYRIPFRADTLQIGRPNIRQIQSVRLTLVAPDQGSADAERDFFVALARMRLIGAPWLKRAPAPISGLSGSVAEPHGEVVASVVSTENQDLGYESPPNLGNQAERQGQNLELGIRQINERSLRLLASDLRGGERAEAYIRFTDEADRNFLKYRELRVWARGRGPGWAENDLEFFIKVGRDEHNFYLYRVPARTDSWEPEVVIRLDRWLALRSEIETAWLSGDPPSGAGPCGGDSAAYVACDGPYVVQVRDPGVAPPNLARVSEVAVGMLRVAENVLVPRAEVWVDDIRLTDVVDDVGMAAAFDARLSAADVAELTVSLASRDDRFRQFGQEPSYVTDRSARLGGVFRLNKLMPESWGLDLPLTVQRVTTLADPFYVQSSDIRADALPNIRRPSGSVTTIDVSLRRTRRGDGILERTLIDPLSVRVRSEKAENVASLNRATTDNRHVAVGYNLVPLAATLPGAPGFLRAFVRSLPDWISESAFGRALRSSRLRVNPFQLRFSSTLTDNEVRRFAYRVPVELAADSALDPLRGIVHMWRNEATAELRPYNTLSVRAGIESTRDLQDYGDSTTVGRLLDGARRGLAGKDVGFERSRVFTTGLNVSPVVSSWLRPRIALATRFALTRDPNARAAVRLEGDTLGAFKIPEILSNLHRRELGASLDVGRLARNLSGESVPVGAILGGLLPADVTYIRERRSMFDRAPFDPDLGYELGFGSLDAFRSQDGVPATSAAEVEDLSATGGTRLPLGAQARLTYREQRTTLWSRRVDAQSEIFQRNREWPSLTFSWVYAPQWALRRVVNSLTAQLRYTESSRLGVQPVFGAAGEAGAAAGVRTESRSTLLAPSLTLTWVGGVSTTGRVTLGTADGLTAGNVTRSDRVDWGGSVNFSFRTPESLVRLRSPVQTTMAFNSSQVAVCLLRADADECRTVSDSRRHQLDVRLDTGLSEILRGGATFSYVVSDQRHTSNKLTQMVFTIFADINLFAGQIR